MVLYDARIHGRLFTRAIGTTMATRPNHDNARGTMLSALWLNSRRRKRQWQKRQYYSLGMQKMRAVI